MSRSSARPRRIAGAPSTEGHNTHGSPRAGLGPATNDSRSGVTSPLAGRLAAGSRTVDWDLARADGGRVPAGIYFARLAAQGRTQLVRLTILDR